MTKINFIRNEYIFKDSSRYIGKRLINQRHLLEQEMLLSTSIKLEILATIYQDLGFGDVVIENNKGEDND